MGIDSDSQSALNGQPALGRDRSRTRLRLIAILPVLLLALALAAFSAFDTRIFGLIGGNPPPPDLLSVSNVKFDDKSIVVRVTNPQPDPISIAIVTVDDAVANFSVEGGLTLSRFERRTIEIPFAWLEGQPYTIGITSGSGIQTVTNVVAAVEAVKPGIGSIFGLGLIGLFVGFLPVALGLMWLPAIRRLSAGALSGFMAFTAGLLAFLFVDALFESFDQQAQLPQAFGGIGLVLLGLSISFIGIGAFTDHLTSRAVRRAAPQATADVGIGAGEAGRAHASGLTLAMVIAVGIGLHNFGEGLAIGASFAVGELAFSALLIVGFTVHNITEGLAIATPIAEENESRPRLRRLVALAAIAGLPAVLGTWVGGFFTSNLLATFFFAIAAGAAAQVVYEVARYIKRTSPDGWRSPAVAGGFVIGLLVMYVTSLIAG